MSLFDRIYSIILLRDANEKCLATQDLYDNLSAYQLDPQHIPKPIELPGYPKGLSLVPPRNLKRRSINTQPGRNTLMHAIAHIEFNAINLALDAAYRFRNQPEEFYRDWIKIADDEARHFTMIRDYLNTHNCDYGDYPAHNGLWDMAVRTDDDVIARMALVPRVLEARGLDVTPGMITRLEKVNDNFAVDILKQIYVDEIDHVGVGSHWFKYQCSQSGLEPRSTFRAMVDKHMHGELRGPFNLAARLKAGFDEEEMASLNKV